MANAFIAVDWGTTNRRAYLIEDGQVVRTEVDKAGALAISDFPGEVAALRMLLGDLPVLLTGMVGSSIGWVQVDYVPVPAGLDDLASHLHFVDNRTAIVPGLSWNPQGGHGDVMRGEEVQLLGARAAGLVPADAVLCQPGTHCKWAWLEGGRIVRFVTAMTGELFALLRDHSLLAGQLAQGTDDDDAYRRGVELGCKRDLAAALFSIRADGLLDRLPKAEAASFASGVLIGSDVAARLQDIGSAMVHIVADPYLGGLYNAALAQAGGRAAVINSHDAFVAGISALWEQMP
jgi:2-dehydro-3-deoxygalactonokinase